MEKTVVLYPGFIVSHFVPMMRLAGVLIEHGYAVSVALIDPAVNLDDAFAAAVARAAASMPSVTFHRIPLVDGPLTPGAHFILNYLDIIARHNDRFHDFLLRSSSSSRREVSAVVVDSMSVEAFRVTRRLGIPGYVMFTSNAAALAAFVQLPSVHAEARTSLKFKQLPDAPLDFFGIAPMPASHLFGNIFDRPESGICKATVASLIGISEADGILVNTFESLDAPAVAVLGDPRCLPGRVMPPVYCVGPFVGGVGVGGQTSKQQQQQHECLSWLDRQPDHSVVFLCFGSAGHNHPEEQLKEIAVGLENSGHRFLWVVREPDANAVLPTGFLERTSGRGLVVKNWVPQADVLRHTATAVFVTHCGWNSVLEGVTVGVPMLCWPLYAEQKLNKMRMVREMGIAVEMVASKQGLVKAAEVERKVRLAMESEKGRELRARVAVHKDAAAVAWDDGGSSRAAFVRFLSDVESRWPQPARSGEGK